MRVLRLDSYEGHPGGGQDYVRSVSDELTARGHPQLLVNIVSELPEHPRDDERFYRAPWPLARRVMPDLTGDAAFESFLARTIEEFRPDLLHLHRFDALFTSIARVIAASPLPLVFTAHDAELVCPISTLVQPGNVVCDGGVRTRCLFTGCEVGLGGPYNIAQTRRFDRELRPKVLAFLCPSARLATYLHANGYRPAVHLPPFAHIPAGVRSAPYPMPPAGSPPTVGYLGRLEPYKGVEDLLESVHRVAHGIPDVRLDIAGDGAERAFLARRVHELGMADRVLWRGDLRSDAKEAWFRGIHVLVVPSRAWENFGLVALEALTRGRPVIATNFGGLPDVVDDGVSGRLVPLGEPTALDGALRELLTDPAKAEQWGLAGRGRSLNRFSPEIHLRRLLSVYASLARGGPSRSPMEADELPVAP
jgi:glycosyltransferase involved in cell wall biosynthesis